MNHVFLSPVAIPDGWHEGLFGGHVLRFEHEGKPVQCTTDRGVRGMNIKVGFEVRDGKVIENTIRKLDDR